MRTLIIGKDFSGHPSEGHTAERIVDLIREIIPDYTLGRYFLDFEGVTLYSSKYASEGKGTTKRDREQSEYMLQLCDVMRPVNVVLLGRRVTRAFEWLTGPMDYLNSRVTDDRGYPVRFWSLPHPGTGRNRWFKNPLNKIAAGKLLESSRTGISK